MLARDGKSDYVITVPDEPTAVETTAANELQSHLEQVTGAKLEILPEGKVPAERKQIVVGACKRLAQLLPDVKLDALGYDGIVMKTVGDNLVLAGHAKRGTLYAVYTFLEDAVGCRWWTSTESFVPKKPTLAIGKLDVRLRPEAPHPRGVLPRRLQRRVRRAVEVQRQQPRGSAGVRRALAVSPCSCTRSSRCCRRRSTSPQHPEWYSEIDGKRTARARAALPDQRRDAQGTDAQRPGRLCASDPGAGIISISQNDWHGRCQCAKCKAVEEEEGSPSGLLLRFVNAVAEDIEKEFPDVLVETLAYQYTRTPPKLVKPRQNVVVRLCSIECSFVQPLGDRPAEREVPRRHRGLEQDRAAAVHLGLRHQLLELHPAAPEPAGAGAEPAVLRRPQRHRRVRAGRRGLRGRRFRPAARVADLAPDVEPQPGREGPDRASSSRATTARPRRTWRRISIVINDAGERSGVYLSCFMNDTSGWLTLDDLNEATRLFEKAQAAVAGDPVLASRVRRERMPLDHVWLQAL